MINQKDEGARKIKLRDNRSKNKSIQNIARRRMCELFQRARELFEIKAIYANNCMRVARKISLRYKVPFNREQKLQFCKKCGVFLVHTKNSRIRVSSGKIKVLCLNCKNISRYGYK